jgi:GntR family transcriptional repressor for pyruvate dehydrogenase complex
VTDARPRTHELVLRHIEGELSSGRLKLGAKLPAERALAGQLGVSRPSIREAIRVLEAMGVIRTSVGSGPDAGAVVVADPAAGITSAFRLHLASSHLPMFDVVQTRLLLEAWSVREAAAQQDEGQLAIAADLLDQMDDRAMSAADFHLLDAEFHVSLARATGNEVVAAIMTSLRGAIHHYVLGAVPALPDWAATARRLRRQHRAILAAIDSGDGELAATLVVRHIEGFYREAAVSTAAADPAQSPPSA